MTAAAAFPACPGTVKAATLVHQVAMPMAMPSVMRDALTHWLVMLSVTCDASTHWLIYSMLEVHMRREDLAVVHQSAALLPKHELTHRLTTSALRNPFGLPSARARVAPVATRDCSEPN